MAETLSIILPAKNEARGLERLLPELHRSYPDAEILVVDDGSSDDTVAVCRAFGAKVLSLPYSCGNGAAIKQGARTATGEILLFMDADGQHQVEDIGKVLLRLCDGFDMVIGARGRESQAGAHRAYANGIYNVLSSWMVGHRVADLTSGFRAVRADKFKKFLHLLPNGFSYPTTITMCFFRAGYSIAYVPIHAPKRIGTSHMRIGRDGIRFLLIIFKIGTLYSPLKLFFPISMAFLALGIAYSGYTLFVLHRFTNMSALLVIMAILVFLIGLISEQITMLIYKDAE